jgi:hypothetical protein
MSSLGSIFSYFCIQTVISSFVTYNVSERERSHCTKQLNSISTYTLLIQYAYSNEFWPVTVAVRSKA